MSALVYLSIFPLTYHLPKIVIIPQPRFMRIELVKSFVAALSTLFYHQLLYFNYFVRFINELIVKKIRINLILFLAGHDAATSYQVKVLQGNIFLLIFSEY